MTDRNMSEECRIVLLKANDVDGRYLLPDGSMRTDIDINLFEMAHDHRTFRSGQYNFTDRIRSDIALSTIVVGMHPPSKLDIRSPKESVYATILMDKSCKLKEHEPGRYKLSTKSHCQTTFVGQDILLLEVTMDVEIFASLGMAKASGTVKELIDANAGATITSPTFTLDGWSIEAYFEDVASDAKSGRLCTYSVDISVLEAIEGCTFEYKAWVLAENHTEAAQIFSDHIGDAKPDSTIVKVATELFGRAHSTATPKGIITVANVTK
jgi:hypothetical protein